MRRCTREASGNSDRNFALSARRALTAPAGLVISMARGASGSALGTEFDGFLFASVREDGNGPLSVLSTLARLDLDPWQTAATLAALPRADAIQNLASLFSGLPDGLANREATASRLVDCLPNRAACPTGAQSTSPRMGIGAHARAGSIWLIYIILMLVIVGVQSLAQSHSSPLQASATQAPAASDRPAPSQPAGAGS